jgi:hypothetical protein
MGYRQAEGLQVTVKDDGRPIEDLERALITKVVDLQSLRAIVWSYHVDPRDFRSPECKQVWRWLLSFSPGHHQVASREELRRQFPEFRFVVAPQPLLALAERVFFRTPRTMSRESPRSVMAAAGIGRARIPR